MNRTLTIGKRLRVTYGTGLGFMPRRGATRGRSFGHSFVNAWLRPFFVQVSLADRGHRWN